MNFYTLQLFNRLFGYTFNRKTSVTVTARTGFVAESLIDGKKVTVGFKNNVSVLSEIAIYTLDEEIPLIEVFRKIQEKENGEKTSIKHKAEKIELEEYFFGVLPNYDEDRVYASDIKKVIQWYNLLHDQGITDFSTAEKEEEATQEKVALSSEEE